MRLWRFLLLVFLAVAGVAALAIWVSPMNQDFHLGRAGGPCSIASSACDPTNGGG